MIDKLGDAGSGRAAVEVQAVNFNNAVDAWRKASTEKKGEFAAAVLSNLGEVEAWCTAKETPSPLQPSDGLILALQGTDECPPMAISRHSERCLRESPLPPKADLRAVIFG